MFSKIAAGISNIFSREYLAEDKLEQLEELLISADLGPQVAAKIIENFAKQKFEKNISVDEVKNFLSAEIQKILVQSEKKLELNSDKKPFVIMMVGVNGSGKTTTIAKLANKFQKHGKSVLLVACDTFRAAAVEQLANWAKKISAKIICGEVDQDPASLAYKAIEQARVENIDVVIIDTAGRLQNKSGLMDELSKISRIVKKLDDSAPHETILVLDATVGQNAISQVEGFKNYSGISGLIISKLDGSAKAGIIVALTEKFRLPIYYAGLGEKVDDIKEFSAEEFSAKLV